GIGDLTGTPSQLGRGRTGLGSVVRSWAEQLDHVGLLCRRAPPSHGRPQIGALARDSQPVGSGATERSAESAAENRPSPTVAATRAVWPRSAECPVRAGSRPRAGRRSPRRGLSGPRAPCPPAPRRPPPR